MGDLRIAATTSSGGDYLLCYQYGSAADLWNRDDVSGRQRWRFQRPVGSTVENEFNTFVYGGTVAGKTYLSTNTAGNADLCDRGDGSGRQRWRILEALSNSGDPNERAYNILNSGATNAGETYLSVTGWERGLVEHR